MALPPVYSLNLFAGSVLPGLPQSFTVPDGVVWIVRDVDVHSAGFAGGFVTDWVIADTDSRPICFPQDFTVGMGVHSWWRGRQVLSPNGTYDVIAYSFSQTFNVCGYQLSLP